LVSYFWLENSREEQQHSAVRNNLHAFRESSEVNIHGYSTKGPRFESQHPLVGSQAYETSVPGDPVSTSGLYRHQAHTVVCKHTCKIPIHIK
ncbi:mCG1041169, partial [Mus musculus]